MGSERPSFVDFEVMKLPGVDLDRAIGRLESSGIVERAERNYMRQACAWEPNDPLFQQQWNLKNPTSGGGINMPPAWSVEPAAGEGAVVAILDTGVAYQDKAPYRRAPDLAQTRFIHGYDFVNDDSSADDDHGHGTHVAGTIAQSTDNGLGVAGIAFGATVMPVKVLDSAGWGTDLDIARGMRFAADNGADVINMSFSGEAPSGALADAVEYAASKGVVMVAASGKEGNSSVYYPAAYEDCIAVGATTSRNTRAAYSNYGSALDLVAPGGDGGAETQVMQNTYTVDGDPGSDFGYVPRQGTSMAAAHVSGVTALLTAKNPGWEPEDVRTALQSSCLDLGEPGWDASSGYGLIDAGKALNARLDKKPRISSLEPSSGTSGTVVNIKGSNFGSSRGGSRVSFGAVEAEAYTSWTDTGIEAKVPRTGSGRVAVTATTSWGTSDGKTFEVTGPPELEAKDTWYLAEGSSAWGFETYVTIANPNGAPVTAGVTYMTPEGEVPRPDITLPALSQTVINPRDDIGSRDFSTRVVCREEKTIAVDRRMIWTGPGAPSSEGHSSIGVTAPASEWYLPEGSSDWGFECWLLIQNPNSRDADCTVTYMIEGEGPLAFKKKVPANSRASFNMADDIGSKDASIKVVSDEPVIPERAMYRNNRRSGHASIGTTTPSTDYYLAEGTTGYGFTTYLLVQNPNDEPADVILTYMTVDGPVSQEPFTMESNSRKTVRVNDQLPGKDFSTRVTADKPVIAERAMYWGEGTPMGEACHDSIGMDAPHTTFYLPDGETTNGHETWTLVANPYNSDVDVEITYMTPTGAGNVTKSETIPANSRRTYNMVEHGGIDGRAAITVTSKTADRKVIVERAMYWNSRGAGTDTIGGHADG